MLHTWLASFRHYPAGYEQFHQIGARLHLDAGCLAHFVRTIHKYSAKAFFIADARSNPDVSVPPSDRDVLAGDYQPLAWASKGTASRLAMSCDPNVENQSPPTPSMPRRGARGILLAKSDGMVNMCMCHHRRSPAIGSFLFADVGDWSRKTISPCQGGNQECV